MLLLVAGAYQGTAVPTYPRLLDRHLAATYLPPACPRTKALGKYALQPCRQVISDFLVALGQRYDEHSQHKNGSSYIPIYLPRYLGR